MYNSILMSIVKQLNIFLVYMEDFTCNRVQTLLGHMVILVHPFSIAFEVYLSGRSSLAGKFHRSVFHYEGVLWLALEFRQWFGRSRRKRIRENLAVIAAIYKTEEKAVRTCVRFMRPCIHKGVSVTANEFGLRGNGETVGVCWKKSWSLAFQMYSSNTAFALLHPSEFKRSQDEGGGAWPSIETPSDHTLSLDIFPVTDPSHHHSTELIQGPACFTAPRPGPVTSNTTMLLTFQALNATQAIDYQVKMRSEDTGAAGPNGKVVVLHFLWFVVHTFPSWQIFRFVNCEMVFFWLTLIIVGWLSAIT